MNEEIKCPELTQEYMQKIMARFQQPQPERSNISVASETEWFLLRACYAEGFKGAVSKRARKSPSPRKHPSGLDMMCRHAWNEGWDLANLMLRDYNKQKIVTA